MGVDVIGQPPARLATKQNAAGAQTVGSVSLSTVAGAYTAWSQIVASTSTQLYLTVVTVIVNSTLSDGAQPYLVQIGRGAAGSEVVLAEVVVAASRSSLAPQVSVIPLAVPLRVASASRLAANVYTPSDSGTAVRVYVTGVPYANVEGN